jgi:hypothetical protein
MKHYTIVYISSLGFYERFKTYADNKTEARKKMQRKSWYLLQKNR